MLRHTLTTHKHASHHADTHTDMYVHRRAFGSVTVNKISFSFPTINLGALWSRHFWMVWHFVSSSTSTWIMVQRWAWYGIGWFCFFSVHRTVQFNRILPCGTEIASKRLRNWNRTSIPGYSTTGYWKHDGCIRSVVYMNPEHLIGERNLMLNLYSHLQHWMLRCSFTTDKSEYVYEMGSSTTTEHMLNVESAR